jgi:hypothetical protein
MAATITDMLNILNQQGFFSYVIPFLLIFAVVFAILEKTGLFKSGGTAGQQGGGNSNKAISAIIAGAIGLLSLQFDVVPVFFANIFPKFGVGLAIFLVLLIFLGFFYPTIAADGNSKLKWIGWVVGIGIVIWALSNWNYWFGGGYDFGYWISEYFWAGIILGGIIALIYFMTK